MTWSDDSLLALADAAEGAARRAGRAVAGARPRQVDDKPGGSAASRVVTEVDRLAQQLILEELAPTAAAHDLAVLSEERPDDGSRLEKPGFWSIDPLDGTLPFVEGVPGYAVSIALVSRAGQPLIGVVVDPVTDRCYRGVRGRGVTCNGRALAPPVSTDRLAVYLDRSFEQRDDASATVAALERLAGELGLSAVDRHIGAGAVINAIGVLEHPPACYLKRPKPEPGGGHLWDFAATACLLTEAGATATDFAGAPLELNRPDATSMGHRGILFASDHALAKRIRAAL